MSLYYRVVEIIDEFSIIINYGRENGALNGASVQVISFGPEVIDPIDGKSLGTLDKIKASLTVHTVYDRFSICKRTEKKTVNLLIPSIPSFSSTTYTSVKLNVDQDAITNKRPPDDTIIKVGDPVELI